ncbi:hypothetical protein GCM10027591_10210 [Zhihengliuella somnathii]
MAIRIPFEASAPGMGPDADAVRAFASLLADSVPVEQVTGEELVERTQALEVLGRVVDAQKVLCAGEVEARSQKELGQERLSARFGCRTGQELLERATQASGAELVGRQKLARQVRAGSSLIGEALPARFPAVAAALQRGVLGVETAGEIIRVLAAAESRANPFELAAAEELLVTEALGLAPDGTEQTPTPDETSPEETPAPDEAAPDDAGSAGAGSVGAEAGGDGAGVAGCEGSVLEAIAELTPEGERSRVRPTFREVKRRAAWLREALDPDGPEPAAERAQQSRFFTIGKEVDGLVTVRGKLMPETAAQFTRLMDACLNPAANHTPEASGRPTGADSPGGPDSENGPDSHSHSPAGPDGTVGAEGRASSEVSDGSGAADHHGTAVAGQDGSNTTAADGDGAVVVAEGVLDPRKPGQKRHDVLTSLLNAAARAGELPALGGDNAILMVHVEQEDLVDPRGAAVLEGIETRVPARIGHRLACTGAVQKVVFGRAGKVIGLGSKERAFTAPQRRAITARDGGCLIPGCAIPAAWCEVHHVTGWAEGADPHGIRCPIRQSTVLGRPVRHVQTTEELHHPQCGHTEPPRTPSHRRARPTHGPTEHHAKPTRAG